MTSQIIRDVDVVSEIAKIQEYSKLLKLKEGENLSLFRMNGNKAELSYNSYEAEINSISVFVDEPGTGTFNIISYSAVDESNTVYMICQLEHLLLLRIIIKIIQRLIVGVSI